MQKVTKYDIIVTQLAEEEQNCKNLTLYRGHIEMLKKIKYLATAAAFSVCVASVLSFSVTADAAETSGTAMLIGSMGDYAQWGATADATYPPLSGSQIATVTSDGQYTVSFSVASGSAAASKIDFLCLQLSDISSANYPNLALTVDSVSIDGNVIDYKTSPENVNLSYNVAGSTNSRIFFTVTNGWGAKETEDIPSATTVSDNITVTFTVSGTAGGPVAVPTQETSSATPEQGTANPSEQTTTTTAVGNGNGNGSQQQGVITTTATSVDNSTTGDKGVAGIIAAGVLAACVAAASCIKRR